MCRGSLYGKALFRIWGDSMKRFFMICLSVLVLAGTLPPVPVQAQSVAIPMDYDIALEIYYTLLCLLETGRIASGYDHSIFGDNFYDNIDEYNAWLAEYYPEVKGITYHHAGGADSLEDWVNKPWSKDGNVISGALSYKLSVLRNDNNLGNFNNNMQDPDDHENDTFDLLHWVNIAASAGVAANGIFANIKNFFSAVQSGDVELPDFKYNGFSGYDYDQNGNIIINGMCMDPGGSMYYGFEQKIFGSGYYYYFCADSGYFYSYRANTQAVGGSRYTITSSYEIVNGNRYDGNYAVVNCAYPTNYSLNIPVFLSDGQAMSFFNGTGGMPLNFNRFNNGYLIQALSNSFMPLIDTNLTSVGFIGMLGALREVLNRVGQNSDPNDNSQELAEEVPDTLDEILPDYDPEPDPDPDPEPDPDPIPEPEPEPVPPPIPDPDQ